MSVPHSQFTLKRCATACHRYHHIVADVRNINVKKKDATLNRALQNFMYGMLKDEHAIAVQMSLDVIIELYRRKFWSDAKTANVISTAVFNPVTKHRVTALKFFLRADDTMLQNVGEGGSEEEDEDEEKVRRNILAVSKSVLEEIKKKQGKGVTKTTKKTKKKVDRLTKQIKKEQNQTVEGPYCAFFSDPGRWATLRCS